MSLLGEAKLLPIIEEVLKGLVATESYTDTSNTLNTPILCRFLTIEPEVIISDKFHSISCILSSHSLFKISKKIEDIKTLKGEFAVIQEYKLLVLFNKETMEAELQLKVEKFFCQKLRPYFPENVAYNAPRLTLASELKNAIEMMRVKHLRTLLQPLTEKTDIGHLEKILSKRTEEKPSLIREKKAKEHDKVNIQEETLGNIMNRRNKMRLLKKRTLKTPLPEITTTILKKHKLN